MPWICNGCDYPGLIDTDLDACRWCGLARGAPTPEGGKVALGFEGASPMERLALETRLLMRDHPKSTKAIEQIRVARRILSKTHAPHLDPILDPAREALAAAEAELMQQAGECVSAPRTRARKILCPQHGWVGTTIPQEPRCKVQDEPGEPCGLVCSFEAIPARGQLE